MALCYGAVQSMAQINGKSTVDSLSELQLNWQNEAPDNTKVPGVATEKAYEYLQSLNTEAKTIVVAVIDSGVDIEHEDLQGKIWINEDEIPDNGIDDDNNGYIDDVYGWNFLGNKDGENLQYESLELTRIMRDYGMKFKNKRLVDIRPEDKKMYHIYQRAAEQYAAKVSENTIAKKQIEFYYNLYTTNEDVLKKAMHEEKLSLEKLEKFNATTTELVRAKNLVSAFMTAGLNKIYKEYLEDLTNEQDYNLNTNYNGRSLIGDDVNDINDRDYGNNDVTGPDAMHGTFVASMIAANRNNDLGINGIATNVLIMPIRAVPDGDEYDKDIALAIRYAVDNGANIINMSFGKEFTTQKAWVDEAMQYAAEHNVLLVHAAGNDGKNNDEIPSYPNDSTVDGNVIANWIEVGANSREHKKDLCGSFSNYGVVTVDVFAPGVNVIGCIPDNKYAELDGTSFASPVTAGVAALVWSYYPNLTAAQLRDVLLNSVTYYGRKRVKVPTEDEKKGRKRFKKLCATGGVVNADNALKLASKI